MRLKEAHAVNDEGSRHFDNGDFNRAAECYRKAIALSPREAIFHNNLGHVLAVMGGPFDEAVASLKTALMIDPLHEEATSNLASVIKKGIVRKGRTATVFCPFPECDGKIAVTLPFFGGEATARCTVCDAAQIVIGTKGLKQIGIFKLTHVPDFPRSLPNGLRDDLARANSWIGLVEDGNVILKTERSLEYWQRHDCVLDVELYHVRSGLMPVCRVVLAALDHPKNPSIFACNLNINNPRMASRIRLLKTLAEVQLHLYDSGGHYFLTKKVPLAKIGLQNSGGPVGAPIRQLAIPREDWPEYIDRMLEVAREMCRQLPPKFLDFDRANVEFNSYPASCVCEACGRKAVTTASQYRNAEALDVAKMKTSDAIYCRGCNTILCMECAAKRSKTDEQGKLIFPLTCSQCGRSFGAF